MRDSKGRFIKGYKPTWSNYSRNKLSETLKANPNCFWKGKKMSAEHKEKCRKNSARYWLGKKRPDMTGRLHPNWKEVKVSPLYRAIRESFKYKTWRQGVFERDGFKCVLDGCNQKLEADHYPKKFIDLIHELNIKTFNEAMECDEFWQIKYGRTLCKKCHLLTPTWGKRKS
jgi:hypothetical protein